MASAEIAGEAIDDPSVAHIDLEMEKLNIAPTADLLDLDHMSIFEHLNPGEDAVTVLNKNTGFEVVSQSNHLLVHGNGMKLDSFESVNIREPFSGVEGVCFVETDQICEVPCKSSNRYLGWEKSNNRRLGNASGLDFTSLNILRKTRSTYAKPARTSIWGSQVKILPNWTCEQKGRRGKQKSSRNRSGKNSNGRKGIAARLQIGHASAGNNNLPLRPISLKIKFGNRDCVIGNQDAYTGAAEKGISELFDNEIRIRKNMSGDDSSVFAKDEEKVMVSDDSAKSKQIDVKSEGDVHQTLCLKILDNLQGSTENQFSDVGTSPDSEVINSVPDASQCEKGLPKAQGTCSMLDASASPAAISNSIPPKETPKRGTKKDKLFHLENDTLDKPMGAGITDDAQASEKNSFLSLHLSSCKKVRNKGKPHQVGNGRVESKKNDMESMNDFLDSDIREDRIARKVADTKTTIDSHLTSSRKNLPRELADAVMSAASKVCSMTSINGKMSPDLNGTNGRIKARGMNEKPSKTKGEYGSTAADQHLVNEKTGAINAHLINDSHPKAAENQYKTVRNAWVLCDDCQKWRRIPAALADQIEETDCGWTCKDNMDKEFADCSVPQEKSDSEINEELELSDGSCEEDAPSIFLSNHDESKASDQPSWWPIKTNLFLRRKRKTQTIDEVMVCHCKPPSDGRMGCGTKCLNRMLNIECVRGTCPCGNLCSNQQFQKRTYAKLKWIRCGKKGFGLQAVEDISEGRFLIEYVGEVLDMHTYEARQKEYAMKGHRHFYFMTLNGSEVIDACAKGNLGRFINHSCEPNCRTEKWMVNGEVCVGLFALRDIKKGEEVTFDYNYVRVFGAAAKKCVCGSAHCRGYIGGDPTNSELVVQDDTDEEYIESVVVCEDKKTGDQTTAKADPVKKYCMKKSRSSGAKSISNSPSTEKVDDVISAKNAVSFDSQTLEFKSSIGVDIAAKAEDLDVKISEDSIDGAEMNAKYQEPGKKMWSSPPSTDFLPSSSVVLEKRGLEQSPVVAREEPERLNILTKPRLPYFPIRRKLKLNAGNDKGIAEIKKSNAPVDKSKNMLEFSLNGHFEAVEQKLNELLDPEGGISKRKDASRGYLKLLFLTAASESVGDGEALQSNRNLSMILDALLKTKSRSVLLDIINKNGVQMLHNIVKRYRKEFIKTPILRKLLKVLEYLAMRDILTLEHITGGPPCPGVESFKDSILTLTEHADKQVHQIARSFRDRWIPKHLRRRCHINWYEGRIQHSICSAALGSSSLNDKSGRSSGGDLQPIAAPGAAVTSVTVGLSSSVRNCATDGTRIRKRKSRWDCSAEDYANSRSRTSFSDDGNGNNISDIPPGFSSCNGTIHVSVAAHVAPSNQEGEAKNDGIPPGFSSRHIPMIVAGPISASLMDNVMGAHIKDGLDSSTLNNLADDTKLNTEEDMPPGFSSPCKALMLPCGSSSTSFGYQERELCSNESQQPRTSLSSSDYLLVPPGVSSPDANHQQRDLNMQQHSGGITDNLNIDDDDAPPGFSSPCKGLPAPVSRASMNLKEKETQMEQIACNSVLGESHIKFDAGIPLSYGVPYSSIQLFGVRKDENWIRAPGLPFHAYPPWTSPNCVFGGQEDLEDVENPEQSTSNLIYRTSGTCSTYPPKKYTCIENSRHDIHQGYPNLGRKLPKLPPWVRMRNGWNNAAAGDGFQ